MDFMENVIPLILFAAFVVCSSGVGCWLAITLKEKEWMDQANDFINKLNDSKNDLTDNQISNETNNRKSLL